TGDLHGGRVKHGGDERKLCRDLRGVAGGTERREGTPELPGQILQLRRRRESRQVRYVVRQRPLLEERRERGTARGVTHVRRAPKRRHVQAPRDRVGRTERSPY